MSVFCSAGAETKEEPRVEDGDLACTAFAYGCE